MDFRLEVRGTEKLEHHFLLLRRTHALQQIQAKMNLSIRMLQSGTKGEVRLGIVAVKDVSVL